MKILLINYEFPPIGGGAGNASYHLASQFARLGNEVVVLTSGYRTLERVQDLNGFRVIRIPALRRYPDRCNVIEMSSFFLSGLTHVTRVAKHYKPDCSLIFFGIPCGPLGLWLKILLSIPYVISLRGGDVPGFLPDQLGVYHSLLLPLMRIIWKNSLKVIANSDGMKTLAQRAAPGMDITVIPNGVDKAIYNGRIKKEPSGLVRVLYVGRLAKEKNLQVLLRAFASLSSSEKERAKLVLVGDGPERINLEKIISKLGLERIVTIGGWQTREKLKEYYQNCSIFVMPSIDEAMSNALLEAMSCELPVLASDVPGNRALVVEGENGFLFPNGDWENLTLLLSEMISNCALREKMGRTSGELAANYSWEKVAEEYWKILCN